jgi:phage terminase large subunit GpA-like protein
LKRRKKVKPRPKKAKSKPKAKTGLAWHMQRALRLLAPPPKLTVSEWADANRRLSEEASAEPGQWSTDRAMYQKGIMDALNDPTIHTVVVVASAQIGKTEMVNNLVGYTIDQDPAPLLVIQPTLEMAHTWSKDRLAPMLRDTPCLRGKVAEPKKKDSNNTILHKSYPGGHITMVGANSPAGLASRPIKRVLADEIDRYEASAGGEGDPVDLAKRRTQTFHDKKVFLISTPTDASTSRIWAAYQESDQREFYVPCRDCKKAQPLKWAQVKWPKGEKGEHLTEQAYYKCQHCQAQLTDADLREAVRKAGAEGWVAAKPFDGVAGFRINQLYSPWSTLAEIAAEHIAAKRSRNRERRKVFVNTVLGEVWEDDAQGIELASLLGRRESYSPTTIPAGALVLTAAADVQDTRIEVEVRGWGPHEESWGIEKLVLPGDPALPPVWEDLEKVLAKVYRSELGVDMRIATMAVDSGGHHTQQVYRWCRRRESRRVWAIKGVGGPNKPLIMRPSKDAATGAVLLPLGVDEAKSQLYAFLNLKDPGPGYQHYPQGHGYDQDHFEQLTSEERYLKYVQGLATWAWKKKRNAARNEALDLQVYNYCILFNLRPDWGALKRGQELRAQRSAANEASGGEPAAEPATRPASASPASARKKQTAPPRRGWVNSWR